MSQENNSTQQWGDTAEISYLFPYHTMIRSKSHREGSRSSNHRLKEVPVIQQQSLDQSSSEKQRAAVLEASSTSILVDIWRFHTAQTEGKISTAQQLAPREAGVPQGPAKAQRCELPLKHVSSRDPWSRNNTKHLISKVSAAAQSLQP